VPREAPRTVLQADATYILVGGMGGIGRALAVRLVESGARNLVFVSRSGATTLAAIDLVKLLEHSGAVVKVFKCDIANISQLELVVEEITRQLPPIKGMFHLGMIMRSALFENMSLDDWTDSLLPKVQGTWNLHNLLPKDLDFFVLVSSFVGVIGNASQAAYAAASSFQDTFSTYRNGLGLPATTVDLGLVTEIGYVADRQILESQLRAQGHDDISAEECLAIIEEALSQPFQSVYGGNLISGFCLGRFTGGDIHHASHQTPQSSHVRRLALSAFSGHVSTEESAVSFKVRELLRNATSLAVAEEHVLEALRMKLSTLLMLSLDDIDSSKSLSYYGLDSLVAVVSAEF
jgi:NADP-dependent 3-hydroxy acid dehydrogenase YdfG